MALIRRSNDDPASRLQEDILFMHGALLVGRICRRKGAARPDDTWLWVINGVPGGPDPLGLAGTSGTLESAEAEMTATWQQWLARAGLAEAKAKA